MGRAASGRLELGVLVAVPSVTTFQKVEERVDVDAGGASRGDFEEETWRLAAAVEAATSPSWASWTRSHRAYSAIHWSPGIESMAAVLQCAW